MSKTRERIKADVDEAEGALSNAASLCYRLGDRRMGTELENLKHGLLSLDIDLQDTVFSALPSPESARVRPHELCGRTGLDLRLVYRILERLRMNRRATTGGGWWRQA